MTAKITRRAAVLIIVNLFLAVSAVFAQEIIKEGDGFGKIKIGESTMKDVISIYGEDYELLTHKKYSFEIVYKTLGLSFISCQADPKKEIFSIAFKAPFQAKTAKGIVLGTSTLGDVFRVYEGRGKQMFSESDQSGMSFYVVEDKQNETKRYLPQTAEKDSKEDEILKAKVIRRIELIEKGGLRQCWMFGNDNRELRKSTSEK